MTGFVTVDLDDLKLILTGFGFDDPSDRQYAACLRVRVQVEKLTGSLAQEWEWE
jgi:hypothetical protein